MVRALPEESRGCLRRRPACTFEDIPLRLFQIAPCYKKVTIGAFDTLFPTHYRKDFKRKHLQ
jgi:hypothetical protein